MDEHPYSVGVTVYGFQQHAVALHKLFKGVADGKSRFTYSNRLHHPRIAKLLNAELSIKNLTRTINSN